MTDPNPADSVDENTPEEKLVNLSTSEDADVREAVARQKNTPPDVLKKLAADEDVRVQLAVAENESTPPEILARLVAPALDGEIDLKDRDDISAALTAHELLITIASNPSTPLETLQGLLKLEDHYRPSIRWCVASNPNIPSDLIQELARSRDKEIRDGIASNPTTPEEILRRRANSKDERIRAAVATNASLPDDLLNSFLKDKSSTVRAAIAANQENEIALEKLAQDQSDDVREAVAENLAASPVVLAKLASDPNWSVRSKVAQNKMTPDAALAELAVDEDLDVAIAALKNPVISEKSLRALKKADQSDVRLWATVLTASGEELKRFTNIPVDSGTVGLVKVSSLKQFGYDRWDGMGEWLTLPPGRYRIIAFIEDCWNGSPIDDWVVDLEEETELYLGDLAYQVDDWPEFLEATNHLEDVKEMGLGLCLNTGGDSYGFEAGLLISPYAID